MSDLIDRQALCEYALNQKDKCVTPNDIMRFPSAQPYWIPCSERNPDRDGKYLVTSARYKHVSVKIFTLKYWWEEGMPLAWMPLPEPYGGASDEKIDIY